MKTILGWSAAADPIAMEPARKSMDAIDFMIG
jgi:hypothetical protein